MTDEYTNLLLDEWANAAAVVVLTRRDDLKIIEPGEHRELGLDFLVRIDRGEEWLRPSFGVIARAISSAITLDPAEKTLASMVGQFSGTRSFGRPVCLLLFTMTEDQAYFCWVDEPILVDGNARLIHHAIPRCLPLTNDLVSQLVERVMAWWDGLLLAVAESCPYHPPQDPDRCADDSPGSC